MLLTSSPSVVRKGSQEPRVESYPLYFTTAADDAVDLAAVAGLVLDPWQEHVLRGALGELQNGKWSASSVGLVVPRQNGKNALLEARELAGLFLFGERLIIHTAHEVATARESMLALMSRLKSTPELMEAVAGFEGDLDKDFSGMKTGNDPGITLKNGNRLSYRARSKGSGRGFSGDLVIADEAYALQKAEIAALFPTMAAKSLAGNYQVWFTSSAGLPDSDFLADLKLRGTKKASPRLAYYEWSADENAASDDVDAWYEANPGLGYRISTQFIEDEMGLLGDEEFRRERLGIWAQLGADPIFPRGVWQAQESEGRTLTNPVLAVDMRTGLQQSASFAVAGGVENGTQIHLARYEPGTGVKWSEDYVVELTQEIMAERGLTTVAVDSYGENELLIVKLLDAGVDVMKLKRADMANGSVALTSALINGQVWHTKNPYLDRAVAVAAKRVYNESLFIWSPAKSAGDITPLRAATAAWWYFTSTDTGDRDPLESIF